MRLRGARTEPIRAAVLGFGYWGPNVTRNLADSERFDVRFICDPAEDRLKAARLRYPHIRQTSSFDDVCADADIELIAIVTPVATHFDLARKTLLAGKDVLIEKPMCTTVAEARALDELARSLGRKVFVDHTFVFNPAVRKMQEVVNSENFGRKLYYDSVRANLGLFQADCNVLWDLAPHDLSILDAILGGRMPSRVSCLGAAHFNGMQDVVYLALLYDDGFIAHCHLSWMAPVKIRQTILAGSNKFLIYNENDPVERIKIYDKGVDFDPATNSPRQRVQYRVGDVHAPFVPNDEALRIEVHQISTCYFEGAAPLVGSAEGLRMALVLEAAERSLSESGNPQPLEIAVATA